jgi:hypothetical protein
MLRMTVPNRVMRSMTFYEAATVKRLSCFFWN